jgi:hypothetical protein
MVTSLQDPSNPIDIKRIQSIPADTGTSQPFETLDARNEQKKVILQDIGVALFNWLEEDVKSISSASAEMKREFGAADYTALLRRAGVRNLSEVVRLFDDSLTMRPSPSGIPGYYVKRAD